MVPVISFAGSSGSGKTTLIERVIKQLTDDGVRVSYIKHGHHLDLDKEGKDTWRMQQAGAAKVLVLSPEKYAFIAKGEADPDQMIHIAQDKDADIIIIEGYKNSDYPKIEVYRKSNGKEPMCTDNPSLLAVATDAPEDVTCPTILDINKPQESVDLIKEYIKNHKNRDGVSILINGKKTELDDQQATKLTELLKDLAGEGISLFDIKGIISK